MATRAISIDKNIAKDGAVIAATWTGLTFATTDDGAPLGQPAWGERTVQVFGTFGVGGSLALEGSNNGTNWAPVANRAGSALVFTSAGINRIQDYPLYVRPRVTAGDGTTNLSVVIAAHRFDISERG
jgi:hypothetical protein